MTKEEERSNPGILSHTQEALVRPSFSTHACSFPLELPCPSPREGVLTPPSFSPFRAPPLFVGSLGVDVVLGWLAHRPVSPAAVPQHAFPKRARRSEKWRQESERQDFCCGEPHWISLRPVRLDKTRLAPTFFFFFGFFLFSSVFLSLSHSEAQREAGARAGGCIEILESQRRPGLERGGDGQAPSAPSEMGSFTHRCCVGCGLARKRKRIQ